MRDAVSRWFKALLRLRKKKVSPPPVPGPIAGPLYEALKLESAAACDISSLGSVYSASSTATPRAVISLPALTDDIPTSSDLPDIPSETDCSIIQGHVEIAPVTIHNNIPFIFRDSDPEHDFELPKTLVTKGVEYRLLRVLGSGAHGTVVLAYDSRLQDSVAIKVIRKRRLALNEIPVTEDFNDAGRVSDLMTEISNLKLATTVHSPFVSGFHRVFQDADHCYIVMPLHAQSLAARIQELRATGEAFCLATLHLYAAELVLALEALHSYGLYHCDLKPENIMIGLDGHLAVIDLGLSESCSGILRGGRGTIGYSAPEVESANVYSGAMADIYSFGVVLFCLALTPKKPFDSCGKIAMDFEESPHADDVDLKDLFPKLLERDPEKRIRMGQLKSHSFFACTFWRRVADKEILAMYVPPFPSEPRRKTE